MKKVNYGYIYKTTNLTNGKIYIGQNKGEFYPCYYGGGIYLLRALKVYGRNNFKVEPIAYAETKGKLNRLEKLYIAKYRKELGKETMYNIANGGVGHSCPLTEEHKLKIRNKLKGRPKTEEWKLKIKKAHATIETKRKCVEAHKGKYPSKETKIKMSKAASGENSVNFGKRWVHSIILLQEKSIPKNELKGYLNAGWEIGRKPMSDKQKEKLRKTRKKEGSNDI